MATADVAVRPRHGHVYPGQAHFLPGHGPAGFGNNRAVDGRQAPQHLGASGAVSAAGARIRARIAGHATGAEAQVQAALQRHAGSVDGLAGGQHTGRVPLGVMRAQAEDMSGLAPGFGAHIRAQLCARPGQIFLLAADQDGIDGRVKQQRGAVVGASEIAHRVRLLFVQGLLFGGYAASTQFSANNPRQGALCTAGRWCIDHGSKDLHDALSAQLAARPRRPVWRDGARRRLDH